MFKSSCVVEGFEQQQNCPNGCIEESVHDRLMDEIIDERDELYKYKNELVHLLDDCRESKHCPLPPTCPPPSCPSPPPCPSCPSLPTPAPPAPQAFCDPRSARPQLCPGQIPCPQCGESICPCP